MLAPRCDILRFWLALLVAGAAAANSADGGENQPSANGEVVALLQTSQQVMVPHTGASSGIHGATVALYQKVTNSAAALVGHRAGRNSAGTQTSTALILAILLVAIPLTLVLTLLLYDNCFKSALGAAAGTEGEDASFIIKTNTESPLATLVAGTPPATMKTPPAAMNAARPGDRELSPAPSSRQGSVTRGQPGGQPSGQPAGPTTNLLMKGVSASPQVSDRAHAPFPPIMQMLVMPTTEAHFWVSFEQLMKIRSAPVDVRGTSGKSLLKATYSLEPDGTRKLELVPVTSKVAFMVLNQPRSPFWEIYGKRRELYATIHMESANHAILKYQNQPAMAFTLGDPTKCEMSASLLDGTAVGSARLIEMEGRRMLTTQVAPGADWVTFMAVFLGLITMPLS